MIFIWPLTDLCMLPTIQGMTTSLLACLPRSKSLNWLKIPLLTFHWRWNQHCPLISVVGDKCDLTIKATNNGIKRILWHCRIYVTKIWFFNHQRECNYTGACTCTQPMNVCLNYILQLFIKAYICMCVFSFFIIGHMMEMTLVCLFR